MLSSPEVTALVNENEELTARSLRELSDMARGLVRYSTGLPFEVRQLVGALVFYQSSDKSPHSEETLNYLEWRWNKSRIESQRIWKYGRRRTHSGTYPRVDRANRSQDLGSSQVAVTDPGRECLKK